MSHKSNQKPEKCSAIRPHLVHSDEVLFEELRPTINSIYNTVRGNSPKYTIDDAVSDAWIGYGKAKARDNLPPSIAGETITCPQCDNEMQMPEIMDSDRFADPSSDRTFDHECDSCNHKWQTTIKKAQFSTCVFSYIRGEIQKGAKESRRCGMQKIKKQLVNGHRIDPSIVSIDAFSEMSDQVCNAISIEYISEVGLNLSACHKIRDSVFKLPARQREVISKMYGFEYNGEKLMPMTQAQVADHIGITRQRVCAIVTCAMTRLKDELGGLYEG